MPYKLKKAIQLLNEAHFQQSIEIFQKILQSDHSHVNSSLKNKYIIDLVVAYIEISKPKKSEQLCQKIILSSPYQQQPYIYLAISLSQILQYQNAIQICNKGIGINEKNWKFYYAKGYILYSKGDFQEASGCLGFAITKNKNNNPKCYFLQAACFAALQDVQNARKNIQYSRMALSQDKKKNCQDLYEYQIKNIQNALKIYERYKKRLDKFKYISAEDKEKIQLEVIIIVNKSIGYGETAKNGHKQDQQLPKTIQNSIQKQQNSQMGKIEKKMKRNQDLQKIENIFLLKSKNSIRTQTLQTEQKSEGNDGNICNWVKQHCTVF